MDSSSFAKINCDGSFLGNPGPTGFGVVLQSSDGDWIYSFLGSICRVDNLCVELFGAKERSAATVVCGFPMSFVKLIV